MGVRVDALNEALAVPNGERAVHTVLKEYREIIYNFCSATATGFYVIPEFQLGNEYRADFLALNSFSGGWDIHFIELEPPNVSLFNRDGSEAIHLRKAFHQLQNWRLYVKQNQVALARDISRIAEEKCIGPAGEPIKPRCHCGWDIFDPRSLLDFRYHIIIGRRNTLNPDEIRTKNLYKEDGSPLRVATYDRLLNIAVELDRRDDPHWPPLLSKR